MTAWRVRITAQLIQVHGETHVWAECYERDVSDVLLLQNDIARAIAGEIQVTVTPAEGAHLARARRVNSEAYEAYLRGRFHWYKLSREHFDIAFDYFQLALKKDPDYALAHVGLAYVWLSRGDCEMVPSREALALAKASAMKAVALDDSLAEVHELLAGVKLHSEWDWRGAEQSYQRAIQLDRNHADAHFFYADLLFSTGRPSEAQAEAACARELDPLNFLFCCFHGWHLVYLSRYDDAIAQLTRTLETEPNYPAVRLGLWGAFYKKAEYAAALREAQTFFRLLGDEQLSTILTFDGTHGDEARYASVMKHAAETLAARAGQQHVPALRIARLYAHARVHEDALKWLERAYEHHEAPMVHLQVAWDWDGLRDLPRFQTLLGLINFPAVAHQS